MRRSILTAMVVVLALSAFACAGRVEIPVSAVTLYADGVAFVEHSAKVRDQATTELAIRPGQLAKVLKSLVVQDGEAPQPAATVEPSELPTTRPAATRRFDLTGNPARVKFVEQLRGLRVKITAGGLPIAATIVSIEKNADPEARRDNWSVNLLLRDGGICSLPLEQITRIEVDDPRAQQELKDAVAALRVASGEDPRPIVTFNGAGERTVKLTYVVDAPAWKANYRLQLGDRPRLKAWATVPNDMDCDWQNVQLTLMSGRPVVLGTDAAADNSAISRAGKGAGVPAGESLRRPPPLPSRQSLENEQDSGPKEIEPATDGPPINSREAFRVKLGAVSIARHVSGLVPMLDQEMSLQPVSVYNDSLFRRCAMQGARLRNTSRHYLLSGTVAIVEDGVYLGDARLDNLPPNRACLLSWGADLPLLVESTAVVHSVGIDSARIASGQMSIVRKHLYSKRYFADNEDEKDRTLIIEHPVRRGWRLIEPAEVLDRTESLYRFRIAVPSGKKASLTVREQSTESESIDLGGAESDSLAQLASDNQVHSSVRQALLRLIDLKRTIVDAEDALSRQQAETAQYVQQETRIREGKGGDELLPKLQDLDKLIDAARSRDGKLQDAVDQARKRLVDEARSIKAE